MSFRFALGKTAVLLAQHAPRVLAIGAHPDDIELGMGGCIHRLVTHHQAVVHFLILTEGRLGVNPAGPFSPAERRQESFRAAEHLGVPCENVEVLKLPDHRLQDIGHETIQEIERRMFTASGVPRFDMIFTHAGEDTHEDHRAAHEATLAAVRNFHGTVLYYQSPSTKPNGFRPTYFVRLDDDDLDHKDTAIKAHVTQCDRVYMTVSRTTNMAANWSYFLRLPQGTYLEAFEVYKSFMCLATPAHQAGLLCGASQAAGSRVTRNGSVPVRSR